MARKSLPRLQRVAAYAVIVRGGEILLSRLAPHISSTELWTLPGGGIDFGEHPADAVVREVYEESGLDCAVGEPLWVGSAHRVVDRDIDEPTDMHSVRIVYDAWVPADSPQPHVVEVDGSTVESRWLPLHDVLTGVVPTVPMVLDALGQHRVATLQRVACYALVRRGDTVLLTRNSARGPHPGRWSLPGGGVEHGEQPRDALVREVQEETGLVATAGELLGVHDDHFTGTAPSGREEDFHGIHLVFAATVGEGDALVDDADGTTDAVRWVPVSEVQSGAIEVSPVVTAALAMSPGR
jgi:8-oxo-dGTP diphosphatase